MSEKPKITVDRDVYGPENCVLGAMFCVNCWPKEKKYAHFMWFGLGLCKECFEPRRKVEDLLDPHVIPHVVDRRSGEAYKAVWGEDPPED